LAQVNFREDLQRSKFSPESVDLLVLSLKSHAPFDLRMLDIMTMMVSMQLQSEVGALRKETGTEQDNRSDTQEPSAFEIALEQAASTPLGEALCQVCSETVSALSMDGPDEKAVDSLFDLVTLDLTVPKAPAKA